MLSTTKRCWAASLNPHEQQDGFQYAPGWTGMWIWSQILHCKGNNFLAITGLLQDWVLHKFLSKTAVGQTWVSFKLMSSYWSPVTWVFCEQTWCWDYQGNQEGFRDLCCASISSFVPEFKAFQCSQNAAWVSSLELQSIINNELNFLVPSYVSSLVANGQSGHLHPQQMG